MVRGLVADGVTVLLTTQYLEEADALADEVSVVDAGRVIAHGTPAQLKAQVGGQSLEVRPVSDTRLDDVAEVLRTVSGHAPTSPMRGVLAVPADSDLVLTRVVARLAELEIAVSELSLHLPTLDEVFFALTGHTTTTDEETPGMVA
jgi:oleandomycin transport system ATP-binding protein